MDTLTPRIVEIVISLLEDAGGSQLGLAEGTQIPRTTLLRRLSGASPFTISELESIAKYLNTTVSAITEAAESLAAA